MNAIPKVSIITINWNGVKDTIECLQSVQKSSYSNYNIIVVDNNSSGNDVELLEEKFGDCIYIIRNNKNYGAGGGGNIGIKYVLNNNLADYILLLDNDTVTSENFLEELVKCMHNYNSDIVSSMIYYYDNPNRLQYAPNKVRFWRDIVFPMGTLFRKRKYGVGGRNSSQYVEHVAFWSTLIKREVFERIGLFDDSLFWGIDDVEFCWRAVEAGIRIRYATESKVWHKGRSTNRKGDNSIYYYGARNKFLIAQKYVPQWQHILLILYMLLIHSPFAFGYYVSINRRPKSFVSYCRGVISGLKGMAMSKAKGKKEKEKLKKRLKNKKKQIQNAGVAK